MLIFMAVLFVLLSISDQNGKTFINFIDLFKEPGFDFNFVFCCFSV